MAPTIHLVRHGQGFHNLSVANQQIPDPLLTDLGKSQCAAVCEQFPSHSKLTHIVASPMRRTLYTALLCFKPAVERGVPLVALPEIQEVSVLPCDVGSDPEPLKAEFAAPEYKNLDFSRVTPGWNHKGPKSPWAPQIDKLEARAKAARRWLRELAAQAGDDAHIAVVTHGGFLHFLTGDFGGIDPSRGTGWENCEHRAYQFADLAGKDEDASLKETSGSWRARRGSAIGLTETEQMQLKSVMTGYLEHEFSKIEQNHIGVEFPEGEA